MKITFVLPVASLSGGIRVVAIYAERLQKRGHEVFCLSLPWPKPDFKSQVKSVLKGKGLIPNTPQEPSHFDGLSVTHRVLNRFRPVTDADLPDADVVVATWWETAEWVAKLSKSKGAKAYFIQHHEVFDYLPVDRVKATWRLPLHKITIAKWLVDLAHDEYGDFEVSLVPNSVDTNIFYASPRSKQMVPTVGMLYAPATWKGCDICLKAFNLAAEQLPGLRMQVFGTSEPLVNLPLPANSTYFHLPSNAQIRELYASCDAWLFGSRQEGFGLPILEAMACRTPVVGTPVGAAPDFLTDGGGILVRPEDPESMAAAIVKICTLPNDEWKAMSEAAYRRVTSYSWDDATDLFEAALQQAIDKAK